MNSLDIIAPEVFLSELLPYDTSTRVNGLLRTSLKEYSFLLTAVEQAITALENDYNNLLSLPIFWTCKTLSLAAQKNGIPLVIHAKFLAKDKEYSMIDEDCIFFRSDLSTQNTYEESVPDPFDLAKVAVVFQGVVCDDANLLLSKSEWRKIISAQKLDVILAGAADHRQYPNPEEDRRVEELNDEEFQAYKTMARNKGYALENPSVFFIQHVYSAILGSMPELTRQAQ
ncbi:MAG: hypothetical protein H0U27_03680 [Nitrosopumilus sp.]|nr:hypothetical protein [Nitrosopumilus sp.]